MILQLVASAVFGLLVLDLISRVYHVRKALPLLDRMPPFRVEKAVPQKQAVPFEAVTGDGLTLRGSIYHGEQDQPRGVVIFCPETMSSHWSASRYCQGLTEAGFIVVSFDFRNQGESDHMPTYDSMHWVTNYEVDDIKTIVRWVQDQESLAELPLGLFGISRGASAALIASRDLPDITHICSDSGYTGHLLIKHYIQRWARLIVPSWILKTPGAMWHLQWTLDIAIWIRQLKRGLRYMNQREPFTEMVGKNVLLISGAKDNYVPRSITEQIRDMLGEQCSEFWIVPGATHNGAREAHPAEYDRRVAEFFLQMSDEPQWMPEEQVVTSSSDSTIETQAVQ